eukprot:GHVT01104701.1.p1 GENE.GHVT01104701.1~~GHVT01104701.1.p1  ORF type:complete len:165 (+),score=4.21 GHVT01104701.1:350-844(+)
MDNFCCGRPWPEGGCIERLCQKTDDEFKELKVQILREWAEENSDGTLRLVDVMMKHLESEIDSESLASLDALGSRLRSSLTLSGDESSDDIALKDQRDPVRRDGDSYNKASCSQDVSENPGKEDNSITVYTSKYSSLLLFQLSSFKFTNKLWYTRCSLGKSDSV